MKKIQDVFNEIQELKTKCKEIGREYRDALFQAEGYEDLKEEAKKLRDKKSIIETGVRSEMRGRYEELEETKNKIVSLEEMLTDIAVSSLMKGESISIKDQYDAEYEPIYKIIFKKIG